jgi:hypothetical protein
MIDGVVEIDGPILAPYVRTEALRYFASTDAHAVLAGFASGRIAVFDDLPLAPVRRAASDMTLGATEKAGLTVLAADDLGPFDELGSVTVHIGRMIDADMALGGAILPRDSIELVLFDAVEKYI